MTNQKTKIGFIFLVAFAAIAAYSSVAQTLLVGFIAALVIPPVVGILSMVYLGRKAYNRNVAVQ